MCEKRSAYKLNMKERYINCLMSGRMTDCLAEEEEVSYDLMETCDVQIPSPLVASRDDLMGDEATPEDSWLMHTASTPEKRSQQQHRISASGSPHPGPRR